MQHVDPGFRQPGDQPITRLPNDSAELRRYDASLLVDPDMRALGPQWPEMMTNFVGQDGGGVDLRRRRAVLAAALRGGRRAVAGGEWTRILPVVREPGLFRTEAEVRLSAARRPTRWN